jgi:hypothetical protein
MQLAFWTIDSRTVWLLASSQGVKLAMHGVVLEIQPCARPASKLKRPGGSEHNSVGEMKAVLHGY